MSTLGTDFDALLARGALAVLLLAAAWAVAVVLAAALEARTRGRLRLVHRTGCPAPVRLWLVGAFTVVFAGISPAQAGDQGAGPGVTPGSTVAAALEGLPLPDRATGSGHVSARRARLVVGPGDSLWRLARERLSQHADDATVAAAVSSLYAANRAVIGPDPDRIEPGQHLVFPDQPTHPEEP